MDSARRLLRTGPGRSRNDWGQAAGGHEGKRRENVNGAHYRKGRAGPSGNRPSMRPEAWSTRKSIRCAAGFHSRADDSAHEIQSRGERRRRYFCRMIHGEKHSGDGSGFVVQIDKRSATHPDTNSAPLGRQPPRHGRRIRARRGGRLSQIFLLLFGRRGMFAGLAAQ